jgi:coproporphyrinogen III oxidase
LKKPVNANFFSVLFNYGAENFVSTFPNGNDTSGSTLSGLGSTAKWPDVLATSLKFPSPPMAAVHANGLSNPLLHMLLAVRDRNRNMFRLRENSNAEIKVSPWMKSAEEKLQGSGEVSLVRGDALEKAAVNYSYVWGASYPSIEKDYAGKPFVAAGVSLICHPRNPHAPIAHMNIRILKVGEGPDQIRWMGGGADLTPMIGYEEDTQAFHLALQRVCERHPAKADYEKFKAWCDEYFFIPHRGNTRGVGGIFFDYVPLENDHEAELLLDLAQSFCDVYGDILGRRIDMPYDEALKEKQLYWRGRYAEFNLVYDRGTRFGLMSGGNPDAILASLPPVVKW